MSVQGLAALRPLNAAEEKVVAELQSGNFDRLGDGLRPDWDDPERAVRAELLRFLILGGEEGCRPHEKGVRVSGAWVAGVLDLEGCRIPRDIGFKDCRFDAVPVLRSAIIDTLFLDGSTLPGLQADRLEARGGLYLRGAVVTGEIRLQGARLGGHLECDGAIIQWPDGIALNANGLEARGGVHLRGAVVRGGVSLPAARLGADFDCIGARIGRPGSVAIDGDNIEARGDLTFRGAAITGEIRLQGVRAGGDLDCTGTALSQPEGDALKLNRAIIEGAFFLRQGATVSGVLNMTAASFGAIDDDKACWPPKGDLLLNRCLYGAFIGGPVDADTRLDWLARQEPERWNEDFWPQPYEQLSTVFREMGHNEDARAVLIAKERLQRRARRARMHNTLLRGLLAAKDGLLGITVLYGRQPLVAFLWLAVFWALGVVVFNVAESEGALKPNSPVVLRSPEWTLCALEQTERQFMPATGQFAYGRAEKGQTQLSCFHAQPEAASYPEFNAWMYSLDTLLPVLEIGQMQYWRPDPSKPGGPLALNYFYFQTIVGWALSLLAVAGFSGIVKSR
ncbi:hypothetical protein [Microvirga flavescens]|uniref:hypothetical protein n=1 Tax=Microvirga flavescens TaxID=2249811 RepID=UPI001FE186DB|nr:hypothetical protein [Microvirga flavescens]